MSAVPPSAWNSWSAPAINGKTTQQVPAATPIPLEELFRGAPAPVSSSTSNWISQSGLPPSGPASQGRKGGAPGPSDHRAARPDARPGKHASTKVHDALPTGARPRAGSASSGEIAQSRVAKGPRKTPSASFERRRSQSREHDPVPSQPPATVTQVPVSLSALFGMAETPSITATAATVVHTTISNSAPEASSGSSKSQAVPIAGDGQATATAPTDDLAELEAYRAKFSAWHALIESMRKPAKQSYTCSVNELLAKLEAFRSSTREIPGVDVPRDVMLSYKLVDSSTFVKRQHAPGEKHVAKGRHRTQSETNEDMWANPSASSGGHFNGSGEFVQDEGSQVPSSGEPAPSNVKPHSEATLQTMNFQQQAFLNASSGQDASGPSKPPVHPKSAKKPAKSFAEMAREVEEERQRRAEARKAEAALLTGAPVGTPTTVRFSDEVSAISPPTPAAATPTAGVVTPAAPEPPSTPAPMQTPATGVPAMFTPFTPYTTRKSDAATDNSDVIGSSPQFFTPMHTGSPFGSVLFGGSMPFKQATQNLSKLWDAPEQTSSGYSTTGSGVDSSLGLGLGGGWGVSATATASNTSAQAISTVSSSTQQSTNPPPVTSAPQAVGNSGSSLGFAGLAPAFPPGFGPSSFTAGGFTRVQTEPVATTQAASSTVSQPAASVVPAVTAPAAPPPTVPPAAVKPSLASKDARTLQMLNNSALKLATPDKKTGSPLASTSTTAAAPNTAGGASGPLANDALLRVLFGK